MASIELEHVYKVYGDGTRAVSDLNLSIAEGEFVVLVGPSGCGKTTALRMVAGLEDISAGEIRIDDRVVNQLAPKDRDVAMVFQNYALYPHLSVRDNIAFGLKLRKVDKRETARRVDDAAHILGLTDHLGRKPKALSGGQRQRVAMGRAIVREPKAFLMDEPLSNLDAKLRVKMRAEILRLQRSLKVTTIYVTHDQVEAMTMGDRVAVMKAGVLQQVDAPQVLYDHPLNLFVAGFIGSPAMNLFEARLDIAAPGSGAGDDATSSRISFGSHSLELDPSVIESRPGLRDFDGRTVVVGLRPEDMDDASVLADSPPQRRLAVTASLVEALGSELLVHVEIDVPPVITEATRELDADIDAMAEQAHPGAADDVHAVEGGESSSEFIARVSPRSRVEEGDDLELAVDTTRAHFFDVDSGLSITESLSRSSVSNSHQTPEEPLVEEPG